MRIEANRIRLFAIDVDGTLLDGSHRLTTEVKDAVCRLAASGLEIALATARGPQAVREIVQQFNFAPWLICFSGGWIGELELPSLQPKNVRLDLRIPNRAARSVLAEALNQGVEPNVFTPETWRVRSLTEEIAEETRIVNLRPEISGELLPDSTEPSKIMLISRLEFAGQVLPRIEKSINSVCAVTFSKPNYLEVLPFGVNKAGALAKLSQTLDISLKQAAAIGDGLNDLEMLNSVGLPIAMGNAVDLLKSKAKWVVRTNDEGGVAEAGERLVHHQ
ncbi:MAG: HAD family phosphatase [Verrucomicrobia bacterium]|nr:HAD family phosphatase [Verrucomicrobiota bacterium]MBV9274928.1 HAD family phosphatase [Verrucomicrobiota bacterium]